MSQENVEIVARLVDAWNQANVEAMLALFDLECEVIFAREVPGPGPFHGHNELREWAERFLAAWELRRGNGMGTGLTPTDPH